MPQLVTAKGVYMDMRGEVIVITRQVDVEWTVQDVDQPCQLLDQPQPEIRTMSPELYTYILPIARGPHRKNFLGFNTFISIFTRIRFFNFIFFSQ